MKIVLFLLSFFVTGETTLSLYNNNMGKFCLFSEVNGIVLNNGIPVQNAIVQRKYYWVWKNRMSEDITKTNEKGEFYFPEVFGKSFMGYILPHEPCIDQEITVISGEAIYIAWYHTKQTYMVNGELGEYSDAGTYTPKVIYLHCELTTPLNPSKPMAGRATY